MVKSYFRSDPPVFVLLERLSSHGSWPDFWNPQAPKTKERFQERMQKRSDYFSIWSFKPENPADLFPSELWNVPEPPEEIFVQGSRDALKLLGRLPECGLAIVGTRSPQPRSISFLEKEMESLSGAPLIILSGMALGVDTAAHSAALRWGFPTIAILGTGLHFTYPRSNLRLRQEILKAGGLIVSEFPLRMPGLGHQFLQRNRLIAGWSKATWIVEAGKKSGALNTARWARDLHRACYAVPCFPGDPALEGNQTLLDRDHAYPYWGNHSLGSTWLELATFCRKSPGSFQLGLPGLNQAAEIQEMEILVRQIQTRTSQMGGIQTRELLDWALAEGWSVEKFFSVLQKAVRLKGISEHFGVLMGF